MLTKNNSIVLSKLKYRDNDLIVKCYTQELGIVTYLRKGVLKSKKAKSENWIFNGLLNLNNCGAECI